MSFDLVGRIKIRDDGASKAFDRITRAMKTSEKASASLTYASDRLAKVQANTAAKTERLKASLRGVGSAASYTGKQIRSAGHDATALVRSVGGLAAAYVSAKAAAGLFNKTIGAAAEYEMKEVTVNAMFGKDAKTNAQKYLDFVQSRADVSMFSIDDFLTAGKSFIPTTKDNARLQKMVNLAERLGAIDPEQGITGAAYALKEFFSGDAVSLVERFELPRKAMNDIKNLPLDKQLKALDKFLNGIGATNELINAQAGTTLGQYKKAIGQVNRAMREMGTETLKKINPLLKEFNKYLASSSFNNLKNWGTDVFAGLVNGAINAVRKATNYINSNFVNNPEFQKLPDIQSKIKFIFSTLMDDFNTWYNSEGSARLTEISQKAVDTIAGALKMSTPLFEAAVKLGVSIGEGIMKGILNEVDIMQVVSPTRYAAAQLDKQYKNAEDLTKKTAENAVKNPGTPLYGGGSISAPAPKHWYENAWDGVQTGFNNVRDFVTGKGHAGGLDRVPYNNYPARLHKDEMVLTKTEASNYRENGATGKSRHFTINIQSMVVREDADIERIAKRLAYEMAK